MKKIFVITGANGFLGNNIIRLLEKKDNIEIRALILPKEKSSKSLDGLNCKLFYGNVLDQSSLEEIFKKDNDDVMFVIHCAGIVSIKSKYDPVIHQVNVEGTRNIALMALKNKAKLIYINSVHAIKEVKKNEVLKEIDRFDSRAVKGAYAKSKAEAGNVVLDLVKEGLEACIIQPSGIIGPYDYGRSHLTQLIIDTLDGKLKASVNGGFDFVDVRDVARGIINACESGRSGECYILSNKFYKIHEIIDLITETANKKPIKTVLPMWLARLTAPLSELYYSILKRPPLYTSYSLYTLRTSTKISCDKAKKELNYINTPIEQTIKDSVAWIIKRNNL